MGRKNVLPPYLLDDGIDLSADATVEVVNVNTATRVGFAVKTNGVTDNTGTFSVQWRIYQSQTRQGSDWITLTLDTPPTLADADDSFLIDVNVPPGQVRLAFTAAGGTPDGTAEVWVTGVQEGG